MPAPATSVEYSTGSLRAIKQEKEMKDIQIEKENIRLSLFVNGVILYI